MPSPSRRATAWMGWLFVVGSACFVAGVPMALNTSWAPTVSAATFFIGALFFTAASSFQLKLAWRAGRGGLAAAPLAPLGSSLLHYHHWPMPQAPLGSGNIRQSRLQSLVWRIAWEQKRREKAGARSAARNAACGPRSGTARGSDSFWRGACRLRAIGSSRPGRSWSSVLRMQTRGLHVRARPGPVIHNLPCEQAS